MASMASKRRSTYLGRRRSEPCLVDKVTRIIKLVQALLRLEERRNDFERRELGITLLSRSFFACPITTAVLILRVVVLFSLRRGWVGMVIVIEMNLQRRRAEMV